MRVVRVRNVSEAWANLVHELDSAERQPSRAGEVLVVPEPVTTVYERPRERVLFCPARNANPFFHLMEALWMLAGRNDAKFLERYVEDFGTRFAEPGGTIHGAYGRRWRHTMGFDQLEAVVHKLQSNPHDRQAVIQMWDSSVRELTHVTLGSDDLRRNWRDRPCNTHVYLRVRGSVLDMTVLCRSNDMIFGGYGANAVHFSVLQEYLAARIGVGVGLLYQVSNNFHVYTDVWERVKPTQEQRGAAWGVTLGCMPMFDAQGIDEDLRRFMEWHDDLWAGATVPQYAYNNYWFNHTAVRVARTWHKYRKMDMPDVARNQSLAIGCPAWRVACTEWLERRAQ